MKRLAVLFLSLLILFSGCKRKAAETDRSTNVLLQPGTGALLVVFPRDVMIERSRWRAQVMLEGGADAASLPRVPLADQQSLLVMHVLPGVYKVTASAWAHGGDPVSGGTLANVDVRNGQMTIIKAQVLNNDPYPHPRTTMEFVRIAPWRLQNPDRLREYVADVAAGIEKG